MNYAYTDAILDGLVKKTITVPKMISEINNQLMLYRDQTNQVQFNVLDSHDTARLLTVAHGDRGLMQQALAFTYLQPGVPCLYYGDEYGMTGEIDPGCRKCMVWDQADQDSTMYQFVKALIAIRHQYQPLLTAGQIGLITDQQQPALLKLTRMLDGQQIDGWFNTGQTSVSSGAPTRPVLLSSHMTGDQQQIQIAPGGFMVF